MPQALKVVTVQHVTPSSASFLPYCWEALARVSVDVAELLQLRMSEKAAGDGWELEEELEFPPVSTFQA